jgi:hypothetical protein
MLGTHSKKITYVRNKVNVNAFLSPKVSHFSFRNSISTHVPTYIHYTYIPALKNQAIGAEMQHNN